MREWSLVRRRKVKGEGQVACGVGTIFQASSRLLVSLSLIIHYHFSNSLPTPNLFPPCFVVPVPLQVSYFARMVVKLTGRLHSATRPYCAKVVIFFLGPCNTLLHVDTITTSRFENRKAAI